MFAFVVTSDLIFAFALFQVRAAAFSPFCSTVCSSMYSSVFLSFRSFFFLPCISLPFLLLLLAFLCFFAFILSSFCSFFCSSHFTSFTSLCFAILFLLDLFPLHFMLFLPLHFALSSSSFFRPFLSFCSSFCVFRDCDYNETPLSSSFSNNPFK